MAAGTDLARRAPPPRIPGGGDRSLFDDFVSRLRSYERVPPEPSSELSIAGAIGASMMLLAALALLTLPSVDSLAHSDFYVVGVHSLASVLRPASAAAVPALACSLLSLMMVAAIWLTRTGTPPALAVLAALPWAGVLLLAATALVWAAFGAVFFINLAIVVLKIVAVIVAMVFGFFLFVSVLWGALTE